MGESVDELLRRFEGVVHGPFDRATANRVHYLARAGSLVRAAPGVYLPTALPALSETREQDALLSRVAMAYDPDAVITGRAAGALTFWPDIGPGTVNAAGRRRPVASGPLVFSDRTIPAELVRTVGGLRLTAPALTALDLCVQEQGAAALDRVVLRTRVTTNDLWAALAATADRAGNERRRQLLRDMGSGACSELEREAHRRLRKAGIRDWVANQGGEFCGRYWVPDLRFRHRRVLAEFDGYQFHSDRNAFQRDRAKGNDMTAEGWWVLRFTYDDVYSGRFVGITRTVLRRAPEY